jgi:metal-dependent amidase/aminoacylase/carboxypeptidase family protein
MAVRDDAEAIAGGLVQLRRAIHREPEIGLALPKTQQKVLAALDGLPWTSPWGPRSPRSLPSCAVSRMGVARSGAGRTGPSYCSAVIWTRCP